MTQLALVIGLLFIVYFIGYIIGRHDIVKEVRELTKELEMEAKDDLPQMQCKVSDH